MRKMFIGALALAALATPAFADTLQEVTTKGVVVSAQGQQIEIAYEPNGKFSGGGGMLSGDWRIDGEKLCTKSNLSPSEMCTPYPAGKKSGDEFQVTRPDGTVVTVKIK